MDISAKDLAQILGGRIEGNPDVKVSDFAKIEEAGEGDLSFISNPKYAHFAATTSASVLLVNKTFEAPEGIAPTLIRVDDPYSALGMLLRMVAQSRPKPKGIESPVHVGQGVDLPSDVYVGDFA